MYPKDENEGDLPFDTKEKMEIYHKPSIICLRLEVSHGLVLIEEGLEAKPCPHNFGGTAVARPLR